MGDFKVPMLCTGSLVANKLQWLSLMHTLPQVCICLQWGWSHWRSPRSSLLQPTLSRPWQEKPMRSPQQYTEEGAGIWDMTPLHTKAPGLWWCCLQWLMPCLHFLWLKEGFGRLHSPVLRGRLHWGLDLQGSGTPPSSQSWWGPVPQRS